MSDPPPFPLLLEPKLALARHLVSERLNAAYGQWHVEGGILIGPDTLAVHVEDHHQCGETHLDIGFACSPTAPVLWDCVAGIGETPADGLARAVETWATCTLPVCLEFLKRDGSYAEHYAAEDAEGCPGWHVIHGPIVAFGVGNAPEELQAWVLKNPLLPTVGKLASLACDRPMLSGVKLLFGAGPDDIAEVRVNGVYDQVASDYLKALPWPRSEQAAFARCYLLFVHRSGTMNRPGNPGG